MDTFDKNSKFNKIYLIHKKFVNWICVILVLEVILKNFWLTCPSHNESSNLILKLLSSQSLFSDGNESNFVSFSIQISIEKYIPIVLLSLYFLLKNKNSRNNKFQNHIFIAQVC